MAFVLVPLHVSLAKRLCTIESCQKIRKNATQAMLRLPTISSESPTFPLGCSLIIVRRPVTACRSIEFPLPGKILQTWSNFDWLHVWRTFADKKGNLFAIYFRSTSTRCPGFDGLIVIRHNQQSTLARINVPAAPFDRSLVINRGWSPRLPRSLGQAWTIYASAACGRQHWTNRTIVPEERDGCVPELLLVGTWHRDWSPLTTYKLCQ
jgi:hypothetical protein